ncbi:MULTISPECIES: 1,2-phenylacetyl-CoA epoxidase subunit PaaD [Pseudomonas chlororaphis group]|uniref:1,2-phenylacetyl-CoA epoxidase subunit PaaD n=1 Tax=Pseudomonas chlororaphis group TaxID=136842 RepID=UPI002097BDA6|nr:MULTISPECIES: 1,2-phenylacetyl-CoA epoxidase subunit PaaD [Pseudomonas chlororaphis group]MCO7579639.1 phenylacetate-CoA oxygenase subunit PaaJ [Pseudomonas protegens]MCO7585535.1 phenylacetate-CoA oxygenase subunit PaaJ [Pseudomonas chlororaphis]MCO7602711.1 phenylacetate-CoA oxygenase subunit PaaJ [Pseudomonas chlororaphis]
MRSGELIGSDQGARALQQGDLELAWSTLDQVMDPEVPVVSVLDLGIVRDLDWQAGHLQVAVTPTYSGCPATEVIESDIRQALEQAGFQAPRLIRQLTPAWTTDWITERGRQRLRAYGITPPSGSSKRSLLGDAPQVLCPQCGSAHSERLSEFGSTACKALYRCRDCLEPFDYFKCI